MTSYSKLKPVGKNVLLHVLKETISDGGILLPDSRESSQWQPNTCRVLGVGKSPLIEVSRGDKVVVNKLAGTTLNQDGQVYKVVSCLDILCVL